MIAVEQVLDSRQLTTLLGLVLAQPGTGRPATRANVAGYIDYLKGSNLTYAAYRASDSLHAFLGVAVALRLPGQTTVLMLPPPGELGTTLAGQTALMATVVPAELGHGPHYLQALVEPDSIAKREVLLAAGFRLLTRLQYLEKATPSRQAEIRAANWRAFNPTSASEFEATIARTYVGSLDCPELHDLRPGRDALASHQASGEFVPELWELCEMAGAVAGCLLCAPLRGADALEVVYMGVVPEHRGRGVGRLLLERAAQHAVRRKLGRMLLVVDERNSPASRVYASNGFRCVSVRDAFLCVPDRGG